MKLSKRILALMAVLFFVTSSAIGDEIHDAAAGGDLEKVKALLKENPKLVFSKPVGADAPFPGFTPLHRAAQLGHKDVAELLLAKGANVNDRANTGDTPLHAAALNSHMDVAELLLAKGADVNANPI